MNKKRKKTLDELLVPQDEQPYQIKNNWIWTNLGTVIKVKSGKNLTKNKMNQSGLIPVYGGNGVSGYHDESNIDEETIVIGRVGYYCGSVHITPKNAWVTDNAFLVSFDKTVINRTFLFFLLKTLNLKQYSKSSAQPVISGSGIYPVKIPVPPLEEQKRIVTKVERLLDKLEQAKQLIEKAKETFELRRAAILDKAFRGELTEKWREGSNSNKVPLDNIIKERNKGVKKKINDSKEIVPENIPYSIPDEWSWVNIDSIATFVSSGSTPKGGKSVYQDEGIPFIRSQNVLRNKMNTEELAFISKEIYDKMKRTQLTGDETLLNITGASIGRAAKLDNSLLPCNINQHVCAIKFVSHVHPELAQYWFNSPILQRIIMDNQTGVTRQALNYTQVRALPFPLPPMEEQKKIVEIINSFLEKEDQMNKLLLIETEIDQLKQSILSKAFKGELGTNDKEEESALELLKEVL